MVSDKCNYYDAPKAASDDHAGHDHATTKAPAHDDHDDHAGHDHDDDDHADSSTGVPTADGSVHMQLSSALFFGTLLLAFTC